MRIQQHLWAFARAKAGRQHPAFIEPAMRQLHRRGAMTIMSNDRQTGLHVPADNAPVDLSTLNRRTGRARGQAAGDLHQGFTRR